jgi:hypothetical protein
VTSREAIYAAFFTLLQGAYAWKKSDRKVWGLDKIPAGLRPALFVDEIGEQYHYAQATGIDPRVTLHADIYLYIYNSDPNVAPATKLNTVLDAVDQSLRPGSAGWQNLGNLVRWVRILGTVKVLQGNVNEDGIGILSVEIMATN